MVQILGDMFPGHLLLQMRLVSMNFLQAIKYFGHVFLILEQCNMWVELYKISGTHDNLVSEIHSWCCICLHVYVLQCILDFVGCIIIDELSLNIIMIVLLLCSRISCLIGI